MIAPNWGLNSNLGIGLTGNGTCNLLLYRMMLQPTEPLSLDPLVNILRAYTICSLAFVSSSSSNNCAALEADMLTALVREFHIVISWH